MQDYLQTTKIEPDIDAYGTYARVSAMADFLELVAVSESRVLRADVVDYISDVSWGSRVAELFISPDSLATDPKSRGEGLGDDADDAVDRIFLLLNGRATILGGIYPFHIDCRSRWIEAVDNSPNPYLVLLCTTIAHALGVPVDRDPKVIFEDTVTRALRCAGHESLNFAQFRRNSADFESAVMNAGRAIGLAPRPAAAWRSARAQDAGCDVLAHVASGYTPGRSEGAWTLIGQVTCGRSDTWKQKLFDVEVPAWRDRLGVVLPPQAFLAIPHHAEANHLRTLVNNNERLVLDRMRLVTMLEDVSSDELHVLRAVTSCSSATAL